MTQVTVSSKYQVVIPKDVRRQVPLRMGQKLAIVVKEGLITPVSYTHLTLPTKRIV